MKISVLISCFVVALLLSCKCSWSQEETGAKYSSLPFVYVRTPKNTPKPAVAPTAEAKKRSVLKEADVKLNNFALNLPAPIVATPPSCAAAPTNEQLKSFGHFKGMSVKDAANLNLSWAGVGVGLKIDNNSQVVVFRSGRSFTCPSSDGKYLVTYGTEVDGGVAISQSSLSGNASFATIAANAQISNASTGYDYSAVGFTNTDAWDSANIKVLEDVSATLTVPTFDQFNKDWNAALETVKNLTKPTTPVVIGYAPAGVTGIAESLATGYALMYIAQGKGCLDAIKGFPTKDDWVEPAIRKVYLQMSNGSSDCDGNADKAEGAIARQLLSGIKIVAP
jgi:hypothetical protein